MPPKTRKLSDVNPDYEVRTSEDIGTFYVTNANSFESRKFGPSWRLFCQDAETGESFIWLNKRNPARDQEIENILVVTNAGERVGPCALEKRELDGGQFTWIIRDAPPAEQPGKAQAEPVKAEPQTKPAEPTKVPA